MTADEGLTPRHDQWLDGQPAPEREALLRCEHSYRGLVDALALELLATAPARPIIGLQGCQGSGKSTLANYLCTRLEQLHGISALVLSLDDFYLTRTERVALGREVHPLLATRGVPGTHDTAMLRAVLDAIHSTLAGQACELVLPHFEKLRDDRAAQPRLLSQPVDLVIIEGWCIGLPAQDLETLAAPVNSLERDQDPDGRWRQYVNERLQTDYGELHRAIDRLVVLAPPGFDCVAQWRYQQEQGMARQLGGEQSMDRAAVEAFVQHFERLTRFALEVLPGRADYLFRLDEQRHVIERLHAHQPASVAGGTADE